MAGRKGKVGVNQKDRYDQRYESETAEEVAEQEAD